MFIFPFLFQVREDVAWHSEAEGLALCLSSFIEDETAKQDTHTSKHANENMNISKPVNENTNINKRLNENTNIIKRVNENMNEHIKLDVCNIVCNYRT